MTLIEQVVALREELEAVQRDVGNALNALRQRLRSIQYVLEGVAPQGED
jgi:hypothetical protein